MEKTLVFHQKFDLVGGSHRWVRLGFRNTETVLVLIRLGLWPRIGNAGAWVGDIRKVGRFSPCPSSAAPRAGCPGTPWTTPVIAPGLNSNVNLLEIRLKGKFIRAIKEG